LDKTNWDNHAILNKDDKVIALIRWNPGDKVCPEDQGDGGDSEFIAHAREDIPKLIATNRAQKELLWACYDAVRHAYKQGLEFYTNKALADRYKRTAFNGRPDDEISNCQVFEDLQNATKDHYRRAYESSEADTTE